MSDEGEESKKIIINISDSDDLFEQKVVEKINCVSASIVKYYANHDRAFVLAKDIVSHEKFAKFIASLVEKNYIVESHISNNSNSHILHIIWNKPGYEERNFIRSIARERFNNDNNIFDCLFCILTAIILCGIFIYMMASNY